MTELIFLMAGAALTLTAMGPLWLIWHYRQQKAIKAAVRLVQSHELNICRWQPSAQSTPSGLDQALDVLNAKGYVVFKPYSAVYGTWVPVAACKPVLCPSLTTQAEH